MSSQSIDLIFSDPPYALGSKVIIRDDGKPDYQQARDFMGAWDQPDGNFWESWFKQAFRVLKHGGRVIMFGMDRQIWFNCYYAALAGFNQQQSLYWYFISNFPKATDLGKALDKNAKVERKVTGCKRANTGMKGGNYGKSGRKNEVIDVTAATSEIAKKYEGMKYSVAPLKQTNETILVFQKPSKTGSCLHDVIAYENGDHSISCGAIDIENNRVPIKSKADQDEYAFNQDAASRSLRKGENIDSNYKGGWKIVPKKKKITNKEVKNPRHNFNYKPGHEYETPEGGRFPAQTFVCPEAAKVLDKQSSKTKGSKGGVRTKKNSQSGRAMNTFAVDLYDRNVVDTEGEYAGVSKILHQCAYDQDDIDLYIYCAKVSKAERNKGLKGKGLTLKKGATTLLKGAAYRKTLPSKELENYHPTVKPTELLTKILKLFKTPNPQVVLDPFMGSGSINISAHSLGLSYIGIELSPAFYAIAKLRCDHETLATWKIPKSTKNCKTQSITHKPIRTTNEKI